ncbi:hypothetical protein K503DRAFT_779651 [Rhizopogon vinicolor AM-OR11-026]|uniref:Uncharacterized protein n=1 Tax=Rhizopogon vinicolor AM-OR11-026 TaxID=1314800 RepID=A0A1B7ND36_9AGAM|nr:hypothetical protein K503DRAFT_779651 [Rhizopogon vinicolor AM-OR11-026]
MGLGPQDQRSAYLCLVLTSRPVAPEPLVSHASSLSAKLATHWNTFYGLKSLCMLQGSLQYITEPWTHHFNTRGLPAKLLSRFGRTWLIRLSLLVQTSTLRLVRRPHICFAVAVGSLTLDLILICVEDRIYRNSKLSGPPSRKHNS